MVNLEALNNQVALYRMVHLSIERAGRVMSSQGKKYFLDEFENKGFISELEEISGLNIDDLEVVREAYDPSFGIVDPSQMYVYSVPAVANYLHRRLFGFEGC